MSKLEELLKHVSEHNNFYKKIIKEHNITDPTDITQYPILTRQQLQQNRYNMFSNGYKSKYFSQQLRRQYSSGSSGIPVNVYWDYKDWYASNMSLWRKRLQWYRIHPTYRYVIFTLNAFNVRFDRTIRYVNNYDNILSVNISLLHDEAAYKDVISIINEFNPVWLYIQPFVLNKIINISVKYNLQKPSALKYIESVGELLPNDLRRRAIEFFGVPLANMYGSEEMNGIAYECPNHCMHILDDNVLIEVNNEKGLYSQGEGEAIITNLNNMAMPLIRYNQNDKIKVNNTTSCECGCESRTVDLIFGRSRESFLLGNVEINSYLLVEVMTEVNNQFNDIIIFYNYIYDQLSGILTCNIELEESRKDWFINVKKSIEEVFQKKVYRNQQCFMQINLLNTINCETHKKTILKIKNNNDE